MTASAAVPGPRSLSADDLLVGPRGRRLCAEVAFAVAAFRVACSVDPETEAETSRALSVGWAVLPSPEDLAAELARAVPTLSRWGLLSAGAPPAGADLSPEGVSLALTASVDAARYWQPPDEWDGALALPGSDEALRPLAELLVGTTATAWWTDRLDLDDQHEVEMVDEAAPTVRGQLVGAAGRLTRWRTDRDLEDTMHVGSDRGLEHAAGGDWWTLPLFAGLVRTTPTVPSTAPAALCYPEDSFGWSDARSWQLRAVRAPRVYEIDGPDDLSALVSRFPLDVTRSRRRSWWETTGVDGAWYLPDWSAVAREHDAVHLTVRGYLTTAGRAVPVHGTPVAGACTVLAGWTPGETVWLADALEPAGPARRWRRRDDEVLWDLVTDETSQTFDTPPPRK